MPRKPARNSGKQSPLQTKQQELDRLEEQLKARLSRTEEFLKKVPEVKSEAARRQQRAIFERFSRPPRIEGPGDYRIDFIPGGNRKRPPRLRKERSKAPLFTLLLLIVFCCVAYYAWLVLWQG
ncbi:MAG: hypothetical protein ABMA01_09465 [Chthoniobacteraceae bacterium]